jgi:bacteriocin biosynthesis cyclodehydratase domain-containing protein
VGQAGPGDVPSVWLVVTADEPARGDIDPLVREGAPHLLVACGSTARVGPFVVPGRTACLRCVDAHLAELDPRRPLVVEQVARAAQEAGQTPVDPTLETLALAWAVRDLARYAEGDRPATWSAVVTIDHTGPAVRQEWERHPHCGCAWDELV